MMKQLFAAGCLAVLLLAAGPALGAETHTIEVIKHNFHPPTLVINVGDTVEWVNKMRYGHWVISGVDMRHDNKFFSYLLLYNQKFSHTFREPGDYPYYCPIHSMQAVISVIGEKGAEEQQGESGEERRRRR